MSSPRVVDWAAEVVSLGQQAILPLDALYFQVGMFLDPWPRKNFLPSCCVAGTFIFSTSPSQSDSPTDPTQQVGFIPPGAGAPGPSQSGFASPSGVFSHHTCIPALRADPNGLLAACIKAKRNLKH